MLKQLIGNQIHEYLSEAKVNPLHHTESGKLMNHIHKAYGGDRKFNHSLKGSNFSTHTTGLSKENKEKLGADLQKAGWKYEKQTNRNGDTAHTYTHPTEPHTTVVHVDHDPKGINAHLSNHVVTTSYKKEGPQRTHYYD